MEEDPNRQEEIYKINLPMYCGLLNTNVRTQFERPLIGMIIEWWLIDIYLEIIDIRIVKYEFTLKYWVNMLWWSQVLLLSIYA